MSTTNDRAQQAIRRYLELRGNEVLESAWTHGHDKADFVIRDGESGDLAFVVTEVHANLGEGIPEVARDRKSFERVAAAYLTEHPEFADCAIRLDAVSALLLSDSRAVIRHHVNALCAFTDVE